MPVAQERSEPADEVALQNVDRQSLLFIACRSMIRQGKFWQSVCEPMQQSILPEPLLSCRVLHSGVQPYAASFYSCHASRQAIARGLTSIKGLVPQLWPVLRLLHWYLLDEPCWCSLKHVLKSPRVDSKLRRERLSSSADGLDLKIAAEEPPTASTQVALFCVLPVFVLIGGKGFGRSRRRATTP